MKLVVSARGVLALCDASNFKVFKVCAPVVMAASEVAVALLPLGQVEEAHVWLDIRALAALGPSGPDWREGFDAMVG